jgi:hypothetical protein
MILYKHPNIINRVAIGSFGRAGLPAIASRSGEAGGVARPKGMPCEMRSQFHRGLRSSAIVCGYELNSL